MGAGVGGYPFRAQYDAVPNMLDLLSKCLRKKMTVEKGRRNTVTTRMRNAVI